MIAGFPAAHIPPCHCARGNYFATAGRSPFSNLIYPVAEADGLGVLATLDLGGQVKFGPDVEWTDEINYEVDPARAEHFAERIRLYQPDFDPARLSPAYAGVRPKIVGPGRPMVISSSRRPATTAFRGRRISSVLNPQA